MLCCSFADPKQQLEHCHCCSRSPVLHNRDKHTNYATIMRASGATDSDVTVPRASSCVDVTPQIVNGFVRCLNDRLTGPPAPAAGAGGPAKTPPQTHCGTGSARSVAFVCPGAGDEGVLAFATSVNKARRVHNGQPIITVAVTNDRDLAVASGKLGGEVSHCMCVYVSLQCLDSLAACVCVCGWNHSIPQCSWLISRRLCHRQAGNRREGTWSVQQLPSSRKL